MDDTATKPYPAVKVPQITIVFWGLKLLTTAMGESISDFLGDHSVAIAAVLGLCGIGLSLYLQLRQERYRAPYYWFVVAMIAIFGTMTADAIHDALGIPYPLTTTLFGLITAGVFLAWYRTEGTLSIHTIDTRRRELFYWASVYGTFTLGTAAGDMSATTLNLGYLHSILLYGAIILIPAVGAWKLQMNRVFAFWFAYVDTRPIGASFSDWFSKPHNITGLNYGDGHTAATLLVAFLILVAWTALSGHGVQGHGDEGAHEPAAEPHLRPALAPDAE